VTNGELRQACRRAHRIRGLRIWIGQATGHFDREPVGSIASLLAVAVTIGFVV
jgi:hypothetical protein